MSSSPRALDTGTNLAEHGHAEEQPRVIDKAPPRGVTAASQRDSMRCQARGVRWKWTLHEKFADVDGSETGRAWPRKVGLRELPRA
ncbi:MAG: hypothetical protein NT024_09830, partial [Proteobacteria bacterium]|nr:hypothetical protein [Pseudomonadota bacterium]